MHIQTVYVFCFNLKKPFINLILFTLCFIYIIRCLVILSSIFNIVLLVSLLMLEDSN